MPLLERSAMSLAGSTTMHVKCTSTWELPSGRATSAGRAQLPLLHRIQAMNKGSTHVQVLQVDRKCLTKARPHCRAPPHLLPSV